MCTLRLNKGYLKGNKTQLHDMHTVLFVATVCKCPSDELFLLCVYAGIPVGGGSYVTAQPVEKCIDHHISSFGKFIAWNKKNIL